MLRASTGSSKRWYVISGLIDMYRVDAVAMVVQPEKGMMSQFTSRVLQFHLQLPYADTLDCIFPFYPFPSYAVVLIQSVLVDSFPVQYQSQTYHYHYYQH